MRYGLAERVGMLVGMIIGVFYAAIVAVLTFIFLGMYQWLNSLSKGEVEPTKTKSPSSSVKSTKREARSVDAKSVCLSESEVARSIKTVSYKGRAILHLRIYADRIGRVVAFRQRNLIAKYGPRVELSDIDLSTGSLESAEKDGIEEIERMVQEASAPRKKGKKTVIPEIAKEAVEGKVEEVPEGALTPAVPVKATTKKTTAAIHYIGELISGAIETRYGVKVPYECFCLTFFDENLGGEQKLWGTDLERALLESGAQAGDRIKVAMIGETPVVHKGKARAKKVWSVEKLA